MAAWRFRLSLAACVGLLLALVPAQGVAAARTAPEINCARAVGLCTEVWDSEAVFGEGNYVGHDEPSVLFYSNQPGSGTNNNYLMRLPKDPPTLPNGTDAGGTWNFQLHPAFWFGMAMCDTQSYPLFTRQCTPGTDANIFDDSNPASSHYIGRHPGTAFMEMQFYPPGWAQWPPGNSCDPTQWCAALNIDSLSQNANTGQANNADCLNRVGIEPVNFAFITKNGRTQAPPDPLNATVATYTPDPAKDLFMRSGDLLLTRMFDTSDGFRVVITDLSTGQVGSMTASVGNGFQQVNYEPAAGKCTVTPYAFHPMYSTSSEHTRVPWAAHSYNVSFADETGHFQYCNSVDTATGDCLVAGGRETGAAPDADDAGCFAASQLAPGSVPISGCLATDTDFDGPEYFNNWPGTLTNPTLDQKLHAEPIRFTSPTFNGLRQFDRIGFETDLPRIEAPCNRTTGVGCVNPPPGADFYPIFTTHNFANGRACNWQLGGAHIPGTSNSFGGNSTTEYGSLLNLTYAGPGFVPLQRFNDFRQVLGVNPCPSLGTMG